MTEKIILQRANLHALTMLNQNLIKINLKHVILTLLKNMQNKALMFPGMRVILKKEAVFGNAKIENGAKGKQVAMRNERNYSKNM